MRPPIASFTSLLVMRKSRGSEAAEAVFCLWAKMPLHTGVRTGCHQLISLSVCLSVCVSYSLREMYEADSHNSESMEAGEHGLTRGTCFLACRLELDAVAGIM